MAVNGLVGLVEAVIGGIANVVFNGSDNIPGGKTPAPPGIGGAGQFVIGTALPFGTLGPEPGSNVLADEAGNGHVLVVAESGGGKTTYQRRLLDWDRARGTSAVSLDFLGDGAEGNLRQIASRDAAARVALVDVLDGRYVPGLNVLQGPGTPQARAAAAERVVRACSEGWGVRIGYRFLTGSEGLAAAGFGLTELQALFSTEGGFRAEVVARMADGPAREALADFHRLPPDQQRQQWVELASKVYPWVSDPRVGGCLGSGSMLDLGRFLDEPGWITLVSLGTARYPAAAVVGQLVVAAVERHVMARAESRPESRNPFRLYLDEARHVAGLGVESLLAEGRRLGCSVWLATQYLGLLDVPLRASLRANCATKVLMSMGAAEAAELSGEVVTDLPREEVRRELVSLRVGEAVVVRRGHPAAKVRMPDFPVPAADAGRLGALRLRALAETGVPAEEAAEAACARAAWIRGLGAEPAPEVSHRRRPVRREGADG